MSFTTMASKVLVKLALLLAFCVPVLAQTNSTYGSITTGNTTCTPTNCVYFQIPPGVPWLLVNVTGTWSGTITVRAVTSTTATYQNLNSQPWLLMSTISANQSMSVATAGASFLLVESPAWMSGKASVTITASADGTPLLNPVFLGTITAAGCVTTAGQPCSGGGLPAATVVNSAPVYAAPGTTVVPNVLGSSLIPDSLGNLDAKAVSSAYYGSAFAGDSNTACYGMVIGNSDLCYIDKVAADETGGKLPVGGGYIGTAAVDMPLFINAEQWLPYPTDATNPINHLMIGTNTIDQANAMTTAWTTGATQEMYEVATWQTTGPREKYFPDDTVWASTTGTWNPNYIFKMIGMNNNGAGCSVGDVLTIPSNGQTLQVDSVVGGVVGYFHMLTNPFANPGMGATTGGTCTTEPVVYAVAGTNTLHTSISTGSSDSITYSNIPVEQGCVFLDYMQWPDVTNPQNYGYLSGSTFSVFADGSGTALVDSLTGLSVLSSNLSDAEQPRELQRFNGSFWTIKAAKFCGLSAGTHSFAINKVTGGTEGILALVSPRGSLNTSVTGPNLNVVGIIHTYPQATDPYAAAEALYNANYSAMVTDLRNNFGRKISYTDSSMVDMSQNYYATGPTSQVITSCGISGGVATFGATAATAIYTAGQQIFAENMVACSILNGVPLIVGASPTSTSWTATAEFPTSKAGQTISAASIAYAADTGFTVLALNGWVVNTQGSLHMPQNAQLDLARLVENADRTTPGVSGVTFVNTGDLQYGLTGGDSTLLSAYSNANFTGLLAEGLGTSVPSWVISPTLLSLVVGVNQGSGQVASFLGNTYANPLIQLGTHYAVPQPNEGISVGNNGSINGDGNGNVNVGVGYSAAQGTGSGFAVSTQCASPLTATATTFSIASNILTINFSSESFTVGQYVAYSGFTDTYLNQQGGVVLTSTGTAITVAFVHANVGATSDAGLVSALSAYPYNQFDGCTQQYVQSGNIFSFQDVTPATSGANSSNAKIQIVGHFYDTVAQSTTDTWQIQELLGTGTTPTSTLNISHATGVTTGTQTVQVPNLTVTGTCTGCGGSGGTTTNALTGAASGGAAAGTTFNGAAAVTFDYHTLGAAPLASPTFTGTVTVPNGSVLGTPTSINLANATFPTLNQSTSGNAATATNMSTNGTANQVWGMNSGATAQGWQSVSGAGTVNSGTIDQLAWYAGSGTAVSGLATANNGVLVTSSGGVPSISTALPSGLTATNLTLTTPALGTPASGVITNLTGTCTACTANSAGSVANALTLNNGGAGAVSGATYNGSAAVTLSYNTLGASPLAGSSSLTTLGTIGTGVWQGTAIAAGYGGTGISTASSTGIAQVAAGTWSVGNTLAQNLTLSGANTLSSLNTFSNAPGTASGAYGTLFSGAPNTSSLFNPVVYISGGATAPTWANESPMLAVNAPSGYNAAAHEFEISANGTVVFSVINTGALTSSNSLTGTAGFFTNKIEVANTGSLAFSSSGASNGTVDTTLCRSAAGVVEVGSSTGCAASGTLSATSLLATGIADGQAPVTLTTSATATLGGTYQSGYTFNQEATAATAITYTLPTAAAGKQYCVANSYNGSAATTGTIELLTSASGQFIIFTDGTLSATGGYVQSGGAARDSACVVGVDATHWMLYVSSGTWSKH